MEKVTEEKPVTVTVQRGKERVRVETRIVLPRREAGITARVEAQYLPADKEIQIVSRTVTEMRVTLPAGVGSGHSLVERAHAGEPERGRLLVAFHAKRTAAR